MKTTIEQWKDVKDYEGLYRISHIGQIKSLHKWRGHSSRLLNPSLKNGYPFVYLTNYNHKKGYYIHRLVMETFIGLCPQDMECRHLDGNRTNNQLNNLKWGTRSQNSFDSINHGTWNHPPSLRGMEHGRAKLTDNDVHKIRQIYSNGKLTQIQIAEQFNITQYTISDIVNRRTWKHI